MSSTESNGADRSGPDTRWFIGAAVLMLVAGAMAVLRLAGFDDWATAGQFGDYAGLVGTLANAAALFAALWAVGLQREELRLQREEMAASRAVQQQQASAQAALVEATVKLAESQDRVSTSILMSALVECSDPKRGALWTPSTLTRWVAEHLKSQGIEPPPIGS
jgi:hypothetical protein